VSLVITVASSFSDPNHVPLVAAMRAAHTVIDYRDRDGNASSRLGISDGWTFAKFVAVVRAPETREWYEADRKAISDADAMVLMLTPGRACRSACWEAGIATGLGKPVIIHVPKECEHGQAQGVAPETVYATAHAIVHDADGLLIALAKLNHRR
jgi:hypothetical protein